MKPNTDGQAQPDLIKEAESVSKTRTYKNPDGTELVITDEQFANVVEIFKDLLKMRNEKDTQPDNLEPDLDPQIKNNDLNRKAG